MGSVYLGYLAEGTAEEWNWMETASSMRVRERRRGSGANSEWVVSSGCSILLAITMMICVRGMEQVFSTLQLPNAPTTLQGPFQPITIPFNKSLGFASEDLNGTDPRVVRKVSGWQPEQIFLAVSPPDAMDVSWVTGKSLLGLLPGRARIPSCFSLQREVEVELTFLSIWQTVLDAKYV